MLIVLTQQATPYYDDSYVVNSVNTGPWGDAIMQEAIPYVESHFRLIPKGYARVLSGDEDTLIRRVAGLIDVSDRDRGDAKLWVRERSGGNPVQ